MRETSVDGLPAATCSASALRSVSIDSSAHLSRAGLISMPRSSRTSWLPSASDSAELACP